MQIVGIILALLPVIGVIRQTYKICGKIEHWNYIGDEERSSTRFYIIFYVALIGLGAFLSIYLADPTPGHVLLFLVLIAIVIGIIFYFINR